MNSILPFLVFLLRVDFVGRDDGDFLAVFGGGLMGLKEADQGKEVEC